MKRGGGKSALKTVRLSKILVYVFLCVFVILVVGFIIGFYDIILSFFSSDGTKDFICGDGTLDGECSLRKPYYCEGGFLIEKASVCGCPDNLYENGDLCLSEYHFNPKFVNLSYVLNGRKNIINFVSYGGMANYLGNLSRSINYQKGQIPFRVDFKLKYINESEQNYFLYPLVIAIQNRAKDKLDQVRIAISLVQNIPFAKSEKNILVGNGDEVLYFRYPYEILYEYEGICGEKSALLAYLLKELGYKVSIFYFKDQNHEAVGIGCPSHYTFGESEYCFVETSGPSIISDSTLTYFGGITLGPNPEVMVISEGLSLPEGIKEYADAEVFSKARNSMEMESLQIRKIIEKYGLSDVYYLD